MRDLLAYGAHNIQSSLVVRGSYVPEPPAKGENPRSSGDIFTLLFTYILTCYDPPRTLIYLSPSLVNTPSTLKHFFHSLCVYRKNYQTN